MLRISQLVLFLCILILPLSSCVESGENGSAKQGSNYIGELRVVVEENTETTRLRYFLVESESKQRHELSFQSGLDVGHLQTGSQFEILASTSQGMLLVQDIRLLKPAILDPSILIRGQASATQTQVYERKLLVIFTHLSGAAPYASEQRMLDDLAKNDQIYDEASFGKIKWNYDIDGNGPDFYHAYISGDPQLCATSSYAWADAASSYVENNYGVNLSQYNHIVFALPQDMPCTWSGHAEIGSPDGAGPYKLWMKTDNLHSRVLIHELGHSLGMNHSQLDENADGITDVAYGDASCFMGYMGGHNGLLNVSHMQDLHIFKDYPANVLQVSQSSVQHIYPSTWPLDTAPGPQIIQAFRGTTQGEYLFSTRAENLTDQFLDPAFFDVVHIHHRMPNSSYSFFVKTIALGESFEDPADKIAIHYVENLGSGVAKVEIIVDAMPIPTNVAPQAQAQDIQLKAGESQSLTLSYSDQDGPGPYTYSIVAMPIHGSLSGLAPNMTYTADVDYVGLDTITWTVHDGLSESKQANVSISVLTKDQVMPVPDPIDENPNQNPTEETGNEILSSSRGPNLHSSTRLGCNISPVGSPIPLTGLLVFIFMFVLQRYRKQRV